MSKRPLEINVRIAICNSPIHAIFFTNFPEPIAQLSDVKDSNPLQGNLPLQYRTYLQTLILAKDIH